MLTTTQNSAFIDAQVYDTFILDNLPAYLLPESFWRDVSMFGSGTTLNVKAIGEVTIQDMAEDVEPAFTPIDTNTLTMTITDWPGDAWYITDMLREDGAQIPALLAMRAQAAMRALAENHESRFYSALSTGQTNANVNLVNGRPHRWVAGGSGGTNRLMTMEDIIAMTAAFDMANVPAEGRIAIFSPMTAATFNSLTNLVNVSNNPMFEGIVNEGFTRNHKFVKNVYGWDIYTSTLLPTKTATEALNASSYQLANDTAEIGDVANIFMCVADDNCKPAMHAWRRKVKTETWRDHKLERDAFKTTSRFGFGIQRTDTLGVIFTNPAAY